MPEARDQSDLVMRYLLGVASDKERLAVEEDLFATDADLNKLLQAEDDLIDDYVRGTLNESDRRLFESNFLCTQRRRQQVELVRSFVETLAQVDHADSSSASRRSLQVEERATGKGPDHSRQSGPSPAQLAVSHAQEWFTSFLHWLDPDLEKAGEKYESIRTKLINFFATRGSDNPEELADVTIDRVCVNVSQLSEIVIPDPTAYFFGVAGYVWKEAAKQRTPPRIIVALQGTYNAPDQTPACLEKCLEQLSETNRELILQYYKGEKRSRIANRDEMAKRLGLTPKDLRIRVAKIRRLLENCVKSCLQEGQATSVK